MNIAAIGIDLGKNTFHLVALDTAGHTVLRRKVTKRKLIDLTATLPPTLIGMEACGGAHHLGRLLRAQGHDAQLIPAQFVKPFVKSQKNDFLDAEAIAEAVQRPNMRFVPIKTEEQLDMQTLHRVRDRLVGRRTALVNQIRAILLERGLTFAQGRPGMARLLAELLAADTVEISSGMRELLSLLGEEWQDLEQRINTLTGRIEAAAKENEVCRKLAAVPGIGPLTATALVAAVADGSMFRRARDLSAWLGLVPQQRSTGGKTKLLGISKRGNSYLRRLLVVGAQSARLNLKRDKHPRLGEWLTRLEQRVHRNTAVVALANKLARTAWVILRQGINYDPTFGRPRPPEGARKLNRQRRCEEEKIDGPSVDPHPLSLIGKVA